MLKKKFKKISSKNKKLKIFVDYNVIVYWLMAEGGIFDFFVKKFSLSEEFKKVFISRYEPSISFLNKISKSKNCELFFSSLVLNEIFSSIKSEVISLLLFKEGVPISKWSDPRNNPTITEKFLEELYEKISFSIDLLHSKKILLNLYKDANVFDHKDFLEFFPFILFLSSSKTNDAILLTTAISYDADFFITNDRKLIKDSKKIEFINLNVVSPKDFMNRFKKKCK